MDYIGIVSLVWVIYIFLFTDADREISDLLQRLRFSISINDEGGVDISQLQAKQMFGVLELKDLALSTGKEHAIYKNIRRFFIQYNQIQEAKKFLIINLYLFTVHSLVVLALESDIYIFWVTHLIASLLFGSVYYWYAQRMNNIRFIQFNPVSSA